MIGDIAPEYSAVVSLNPRANIVAIEFTREIDADVLADLAKLKDHPAIEMITGQCTSLLFFKDSYDPKKIAEAISKSLEENHSFEVRRRLNGSMGYKDIHCFTEGK